MSRGGRPAGRTLSPIELQHLQLLVRLREKGKADDRGYGEQIEDFVLELREGGCSTRSIAEAIGVGSSTVQGWIDHARERRGG
jgi:hypothetical protein